MISWSFYWFIFVLDEIFFVGVCMFNRFGFLEGVIDFFFFSDLVVSRSLVLLRCEMF